MKILKQIIYISLALLLVISLFSNVWATNSKTTLKIMQQASETKYLENEQGYISKTIVDSNADTGEVTIELKVSNTKKDTETVSGTEVFIVVDNSPSMDFITASGESRKKLVLDSALELVESIFNISTNVKIGLVDFHGYGFLFGGSATIYDATVRQKLTNNKDSVVEAINKQLQRSTSSGTNIQAGLKMAERNFSESAGNKVIVLLTDGIPNADINGNYDHSDDLNSETQLAIQETTKQTLLDLKSKGIYTVTMLTGMDETDKDTDGKDIFDDAGNSLENNLAAAERVFGTPGSPSANKYYLVKSADLNTVITSDILKDVSSKISNPINEVQIVDYFPENIIDNFDFSYVGKPSVGTVNEAIDTETNTITWNIGTLKGDEVATLRYKLKIEDMNNADLLGKTIATNEKVELTYTDSNEEGHKVILTSSPKIQLAEVIIPDKDKGDDSEKQDENDSTISPNPIPQAGIGIGIGVLSVGLIVGGIIAYIRYNRLKDI